MDREVTGVIPCYNSASTLKQTINSLKSQTLPLSEIIVVDDGSTDNSAEIAVEMGCTVISNTISLGRGYTRMIGVKSSQANFVLFCDSSNIVPSNFAEIAIKHFEEDLVCACFGRILNYEGLTDDLSNWRARHLFGENKPYNNKIHQVNCLITYAVLLRREHVLSVGNFNPSLKQCEDQELGEKLIAQNLKIISDPNLITYSIRKETFKSLSLRYARWNSDYAQPKFVLIDFLDALKVCILIFSKEDLKDKQYKCLTISLLMPFIRLYYEFVKEMKLLQAFR